MRTTFVALLCLSSIAFVPLVSAQQDPNAPPPQDPVTPKVCAQVSRDPDCLRALCTLVGNTAAALVGQKVSDCLSDSCALASQRLAGLPALPGTPLTPPYQVLPGATCDEVICRNVPPLFAYIRVAAAPVAGLLSILEGAVGTDLVLHRVVTRAAFYCDPSTGGGSGSPCQEDLTTDHVRVGGRAFAFYDLADPPGFATECSWVLSNVGGVVYVYDTATANLNVFSSCTVYVRVIVSAGGSTEDHDSTTVVC